LSFIFPQKTINLFFKKKFASKVILFQEALQFKETIILCYNMQNFVRMNAKVAPPLTWHICHIIVAYIGLVVSICILNQSRGHWLLSDALNFAISMNLKFKDEIDSATFDSLMEEDGNVAYELSCLASNIKKKVFQILDSFFSF